ncbi:MAG: hypothetical protein IPK06_04820 [Ignavibacteriae bacterium]|nr:hypothetical protein [Ignavibacteriota bacterium]
MGFWDDVSPEQRALIKGREKVPKCVAAKIIGIKREYFDRAYVNTGLITGFIPAGYKTPLFMLGIFLPFGKRTRDSKRKGRGKRAAKDREQIYG